MVEQQWNIPFDPIASVQSHMERYVEDKTTTLSTKNMNVIVILFKQNWILYIPIIYAYYSSYILLIINKIAGVTDVL